MGRKFHAKRRNPSFGLHVSFWVQNLFGVTGILSCGPQTVNNTGVSSPAFSLRLKDVHIRGTHPAVFGERSSVCLNN
jgi:hypothetical protein